MAKFSQSYVNIINKKTVEDKLKEQFPELNIYIDHDYSDFIIDTHFNMPCLSIPNNIFRDNEKYNEFVVLIYKTFYKEKYRQQKIKNFLKKHSEKL